LDLLPSELRLELGNFIEELIVKDASSSIQGALETLYPGDAQRLNSPVTIELENPFIVCLMKISGNAQEFKTYFLDTTQHRAELVQIIQSTRTQPTGFMLPFQDMFVGQYSVAKKQIETNKR